MSLLVDEIGIAKIKKMAEFYHDNNSAVTERTEVAQNKRLYLKYIAYVAMGVILIIVNGLIVISILFHRVLRAKKEYLLLAGLSTADLLIGISELSTGAYRWNLMDTRSENNLFSPRECALRPHFVFLTFSLMAQAIMILAVTVDRLIAVLKPLQHNTLSTTYTIIIIASSFFLAFMLAGSVWGYLLIAYGIKNTEKLSALCNVSPVDKIYDSLHCVRTVLAILSVILYIIVWYMYKKTNRATIAYFPSAAFRLRRSQRHLTATVGICVMFTFFLYVMPTSIQVIAMWTQLDKQMDSWHDVPCVLICLNAIINVFIYSLRHQDLRKGLKMILYCRQLPSPAALRLKKESVETIVDNNEICNTTIRRK